MAAVPVVRSRVEPKVASVTEPAKPITEKRLAQHEATRSISTTRVSRLGSMGRPTIPSPLPSAVPTTSQIASVAITPEKTPATPTPPREAPRPDVPISVPEGATRVAAASDAGGASVTRAAEPSAPPRLGFTLAGSGTGRRGAADVIDPNDAKAQLVVRNFGSIVGSRGTSGL
jgi:hypothetical protein